MHSHLTIVALLACWATALGNQHTLLSISAEDAERLRSDADNHPMFAHIANLQRDVGNVQREIVNMVQDRSNSYRTRDQASQQAAQEESAAGEADREAERMKGMLAGLRQKRDNVQQALSAIQAQYTQLDAERSRWKQQLDGVLGNKVNAQKSSVLSQAKRVELAKQLADLKKKITAAEAAKALMAGKASKQISKYEARLANLQTLVKTTEGGLEGVKKGLEDKFIQAKQADERATVAHADAKARLRKSEDVLAGTVRDVTSSVSSIRNSRLNAQKLAQEAIEQVRQARDAADTNALAAVKILEAAKQQLSVREQSLLDKKSVVNSTAQNNTVEAATLVSQLEQLKGQQLAQQQRFEQEQQQRDHEMAAITLKMQNAQRNLQGMQAQQQASNDLRAANLQMLQEKLEQVKALAAKEQNRTARGLRFIDIEQEKLRAAVDEAKLRHDSTAAALAGQATKLLNETRVAEAAIAEMQAAKLEAEQRFKAEQSERAVSIQASEAAVALANEQRSKVELALAAERAERDRQIRDQRAAVADAENARLRKRRDVERAFLSQASDLRTGLLVAKHDVDAVQAKKDNAQLEFDTVSRELQLRKKELDGVNRERSLVNDQLNALRAKRAELESGLVENAAKADTSQGDIRMKETALADALDLLNKVRVEAEAVEKRKDAASGLVSKAETRLRDAGTANQAVGADLDRTKAVQATIAQLAQAISSANKRLDSADTMKATLERQIVDLQQKKSYLEVSVASLQERIDARKSAALVAVGSNAELKDKETDLRKQISAMKLNSDQKVAATAKELKQVRSDTSVEVTALQNNIKTVNDQKVLTSSQLAAETSQLFAKEKALEDKFRHETESTLSSRKAEAEQRIASGEPHPASAAIVAALSPKLASLAASLSRIEAREAVPENRREGSAVEGPSTLAESHLVLGEHAPTGGIVANLVDEQSRPIVAPDSHGSGERQFGSMDGEAAVSIERRSPASASAMKQEANTALLMSQRTGEVVSVGG